MAVVQVAQGKLQGAEDILSSKEKFYSFKGIPYAKPPLGKLRFKDPHPVEPWTGIRDATKSGPVCPQVDPKIGSMPVGSDEDCLYLNVYTRNINIHSRTPVMLWIHGGAFTHGSGDSDLYGPKFLLRHDVVLVTINYRLEAFGFLCLDTPEVPGNAGMKDQVMAIRWVKENIEHFGGDPDDVTIFGESAGAASVALHLVSPLSKGSFSKAIVQSGSCLADWSFMTNGKETAFQLGKFLGKETNDEKELLTFLQSVPANDLVDISAKFFAKEPFLLIPLTIVIEKKFQGVSAFLEKDPIEYISTHEVSDVPVILGINSCEGSIFAIKDLPLVDLLNERSDWCVPKELKQNRSSTEIRALGEKIKKFYFGESKISEDTLLPLVEFKSDFLFVHSVHRLSSLLSAYISKPVFTYYYTFVDEDNMMNKVMKGPYADKLPYATHAADLAPLFNNDFNSDPEITSPAGQISHIMTTLWTNFAKTGTPTPDNKLGVKWERYSSELKNYLNIDLPLSMKRNVLEKRIAFWDTLYKNDGLPI